jgi:hypothetical protein
MIQKIREFFTLNELDEFGETVNFLFGVFYFFILTRFLLDFIKLGMPPEEQRRGLVLLFLALIWFGVRRKVRL